MTQVFKKFVLKCAIICGVGVGDMPLVKLLSKVVENREMKGFSSLLSEFNGSSWKVAYFINNFEFFFEANQVAHLLEIAGSISYNNSTPNDKLNSLIGLAFFLAYDPTPNTCAAKWSCYLAFQERMRG